MKSVKKARRVKTLQEAPNLRWHQNKAENIQLLYRKINITVLYSAVVPVKEDVLYLRVKSYCESEETGHMVSVPMCNIISVPKTGF